MQAFYGVLLVSLGVLLFGAGMVVTRRPGAPSTLTTGAAGTTLIFATVTLVLWGVLLLGQWAVNLGAHSLSITEVVLIVIDLAVFIVSWRMLRVRKRLAAYRAQLSPSDPGPQQPPVPKPESPRKRAA